ncbi:MAG: aminotransferase class V-fold PLP-dependent enzyme [Gammaproteobacteria bacterium]
MDSTQAFCLQPEITYLNHAAVAPWPLRTLTAVEQFAVENARQGSLNYPAWLQVEDDLRSMLARLINAPGKDTIALLKSTSEALSVVAYGLTWTAGDNVVISDQEFPSNRIVWESLQGQGVEVRQVDLSSADTPEAALMAATDQHTRLLSVSSVQYASGLRLQLARLGEHCQRHDILFCVDAIQSIGAVEFDVQAIQADFVMADGHKWMLGPEGLALFYCRPECYEQIALKQYGWHMIEHVGDFERHDWQPAASARRFECGSPNMVGIHALHASISLLLEVGMPTVQAKVLARSAAMIAAIQESATLQLCTDPAPGRYAGIVSFQHTQRTSQAVYASLLKQGVFCACRGGAIRFSPHFYTDLDKIHTAIRLAAATD